MAKSTCRVRITWDRSRIGKWKVQQKCKREEDRCSRLYVVTETT